MTLETSRNSCKTSALRINSSVTRQKLRGRPSKQQSQNERPEVDSLVELLGAHIERMHATHTYGEMLENSWVSKATLAKYKARKGRYVRSDTLRGILRIFGLKLKVE